MIFPDHNVMAWKCRVLTNETKQNTVEHNDELQIDSAPPIVIPKLVSCTTPRNVFMHGLEAVRNNLNVDNHITLHNYPKID